MVRGQQTGTEEIALGEQGRRETVNIYDPFIILLH